MNIKLVSQDRVYNLNDYKDNFGDSRTLYIDYTVGHETFTVHVSSKDRETEMYVPLPSDLQGETIEEALFDILKAVKHYLDEDEPEREKWEARLADSKRKWG